MEMGTDKFETDYIQYLERINANLRNQSIMVKEFENRLLNKEIRTRQYEMVMDDVKNICNSTCEAIDSFFDNFTAAMNSLKNVIMWKSQVLLIPQKLAGALNPDLNDINHMSGSSNSDSGFSSVNDNSQSKNAKKCGTAKVSPMIKGHVISAPRIHLNRVSEDFELPSRRPLVNTLSPIIEQSPSTSPNETSIPVFRNIQIPLRRLKIGNLVGQTGECKGSYEGSTPPKINFTRRNSAGFELRRPYSSLGGNERFRVMRDRRAEVVNGSKHDDEVTEDGDCMNEENPSLTVASEALENVDAHDQPRRNNIEDVDPLEGPSWLLDRQKRPKKSDHTGLSASQYRFVNFKRLNYARSNRFVSDENRREVLSFNDDAQMGNFELSSNREEAVGENSFPLVKEGSEKNSSDGNEEESSSGNSSPLSETERPEEDNKSDDSDVGRSKVNSFSFRYSPMDRNGLERKSIHQSPLLRVSKTVPKRSSGSVRLSNRRSYSSSGNRSLNCDVTTDCYVNLERLPLENEAAGERETPKRWKVNDMESVLVGGKSERQSSKRRSSTETIPIAESMLRVSDEALRSSGRRKRTTRRAAEKCIENKVWVDVTPKWEMKIKREKRRKKLEQKAVSGPKKSKKRSKTHTERS